MIACQRLLYPSIGLLALLVVTSQVLGQQNLSRKGYENVTTLKEAVEILHGQLLLDGKPEFAALFTEDNVRTSIAKMVESFDATLAADDNPRRPAKTKENWDKTIRATCLKMANEGYWPAGSFFSGFYILTEGGVEYRGLATRLFIVTPEASLNSMPVIDIWFGRVPRR